MSRPLCKNCPNDRCRECPDSMRKKVGREPAPLPGCGHYTGRCGRCGSSDLWDDNTAYGCNKCGAFWCGF